MPYYHVLLRFRDQPDADRCVFTDLSEKDLRVRFLTPYKRATSFLSGSEVIDASAIRKTSIIRTEEPSAEALQKIQERSRRETEAFNRSSSNVVILDVGRGYAPEDIAEAGENVTSAYIVGPPGHGDRLAVIAAVVNHPWISAIGTGLIVGALIWLLGLT